MRSLGGETGGLTILEALREYEGRGYGAQFAARPGGEVKCFTCGWRNKAVQVRLDSLRRIEGVSDPADMAVVAALECPHCGARGTAVMKYGPDAPPEDGEALRLLETLRKSTWQSPDGEWRAPPQERIFRNGRPEPALAQGPRHADIVPPEDQD